MLDPGPEFVSLGACDCVIYRLVRILTVARPLRSRMKRRALVRILQSHNERKETSISRISFVKMSPNWLADLGGLSVLIHSKLRMVRFHLDADQASRLPQGRCS